ncbi:hypothetical protein D2T29_22375 [Sinirhodobacter populi]|uniref:Uncharacterized protein n=1 Tax=Paenirhodobacter populi TaxID=2306993 RepID=A0A443JX68_9RHOB|nr:hypothetical protein [Sinirhodobacter populi]RWR25108.1 hypothetical protein D2T29_22375 [Sinirhodobacter populi]
MTHPNVFSGQSLGLQILCNPSPDRDWIDEQSRLVSMYQSWMFDLALSQKCTLYIDCPGRVPDDISVGLLSLYEKYFDLERGEYVFRIVATTSDGVKVEDSVLFDISDYQIEALRRISMFYAGGGGNFYGNEISPEPMGVVARRSTDR